jgi:hypothetical protein
VERNLGDRESGKKNKKTSITSESCHEVTTAAKKHMRKPTRVELKEKTQKDSCQTSLFFLLRWCTVYCGAFRVDLTSFTIVVKRKKKKCCEEQ